MAESKRTLVERFYASGWCNSEGDPRDLVPWLSDDFEYVNPPHAVVPGIRRGPEGFVAAVASLSEGFATWRHDVVAVEESHDAVLVEVRFVSVGAQSGIEFDHQEWQVWKVEHGRACSLAWFHDRDAARAAAGL